MVRTASATLVVTDEPRWFELSRSARTRCGQQRRPRAVLGALARIEVSTIPTALGTSIPPKCSRWAGVSCPRYQDVGVFDERPSCSETRPAWRGRERGWRYEFVPSRLSAMCTWLRASTAESQALLRRPEPAPRRPAARLYPWWAFWGVRPRRHHVRFETSRTSARVGARRPPRLRFAGARRFRSPRAGMVRER